MITGHNHTSLTVSDLERSIAFYTENLNFRVAERFEAKGEGIERITALPGAHLNIAFLTLGDFRLELIQYLAPPGVKLDTATNNVGSAHIAFWVDDAMQTYEELKAKGVRFKGPPSRSRPGRPLAVYFWDPDDVTLELVEQQ